MKQRHVVRIIAPIAIGVILLGLLAWRVIGFSWQIPLVVTGILLVVAIGVILSDVWSKPVEQSVTPLLNIHTAALETEPPPIVIEVAEEPKEPND